VGDTGAVRRVSGWLAAGMIALGSGCADPTDQADAEVELHLSPSAIEMPIGSQRDVVARYTLNGDTYDAVDAAFSSSDPAIIRVETSDGFTGVLTALAPGEVTITAETGDHATATMPVAVGDAEVISIDISPSAPTAPRDSYIDDVVATATYYDGGSEIITAAATWTSDDRTVATVVPGTIATHDPGGATVSAGLLAASGSTDVTVTE